MDDPGSLVGPRLQLRTPQIEDADELFASLTSDPTVTKYLSWTPHPDVSETRRVIRGLFNVGDHRTWMIVLRDSGEIVGQLGYRRPQQHAVELGYCLATKWWGRGLMSESVGLLLQRLQQDPRLYRVAATCHVENVRSARLLAKWLSIEGRLVRHTVFPNLGSEPQDCFLYARALR
jgi:[ribosomal protein S5]-alanine N-acetyltransferase